MITLDMRGKPCPIPMVETKKVIQSLQGKKEVIEIIVDNQIACENLEKMARGYHYAYEYKQIQEGCYQMLMNINDAVVEEQETSKPIKKENTTVIAFGSDAMGRGEEKLGKILIKGFIYALTEDKIIPDYLLFFNRGVFLTIDDANTKEDLKKLAALGCEIYICGTCVDFYQLKEQIHMHKVTNMYEIVEILNKADKVITI